jgi:SAM-dependent methyltransferase
VKDRYSFIAPFYSLLARMVFGTSQKEVKIAFAENLVLKKVLIIGGGDGLDYQGFAGQARGEFWELSEAMLTKAKKNLSESKLEFHLGHFEADFENKFDEVWLHFVLDTFTDFEFEKFLFELKSALKPESILYIADFFEPQSWNQRVIQFVMMQFFRVFTAHPRIDLPEYEQFLKQSGFKKFDELKKRKGWIRAQLWKI